MIYFVYNYVQQKEKFDKQEGSETVESESSSPDRASGSSSSSLKMESILSSPSSLVSPGKNDCDWLAVLSRDVNLLSYWLKLFQDLAHLYQITAWFLRMVSYKW